MLIGSIVFWQHGPVRKWFRGSNENGERGQRAAVFPASAANLSFQDSVGRKPRCKNTKKREDGQRFSGKLLAVRQKMRIFAEKFRYGF